MKQAFVLPVGLVLMAAGMAGQTYDLVLAGGRVMDPESGLDGVRNIGVSGNRIAIVTDSPLNGKEVIDARGLVVAPGFIDLIPTARRPKITGSRPATV